MNIARVAACATIVCALCWACAAAGAAPGVSILLLWRFPAPQAASADVAPVEAGLLAVNVIAPQLDALARHPSARMTFAVDPAFIAAVARAQRGDDLLAALAAGSADENDPQVSELLGMAASDVVPASGVAGSAAAKRFAADSSLVRAALISGGPARLSHADAVDDAAAALVLSLRGAGYARGEAALLDAQRLSPQDLTRIASEFARACGDVLERLQRSASSGSLELAALPAYEPILPLVIDAAGRNQRVPFTVAFNAQNDAAAAVDEGMRAVRALDPAHGDPGVVSPSGAYDDNTAALLQVHHARYGVFSERVVTLHVGAAASAVADARSAPFRAYRMETSATDTLPIFFCSDTMSETIDALPLDAPPQALAVRIRAAAATALADAPNERAPVVALCLPATGSILHRANRAAALDAIAAELAGGAARGATPREFLAEHPPTADTYGYEAASDAGDFNLWMGSQNQVTLWSALLDARTAAGGDDAVTNPAVRDELLRAESARWFEVLEVPQPRYLTDAVLDQFRALLAALYRAANKPVPAHLAPITLKEAPAATPAAHAAPRPPAAPSPTAAPSPAALPTASPAPAPRSSG